MEWALSIYSDFYVLIISEGVKEEFVTFSMFIDAAAVHYTPGVAPVFLENVTCGGDEESLTECQTDGSTGTCMQHAGVQCERKLITQILSVI